MTNCINRRKCRPATPARTLGHRSGALALALIALGALGLAPRRAQALEMQREAYRFYTYYAVTENGVPVGTVVRTTLQQPIWRTYSSHAADGTLEATATQVDLIWGRWLTSNMALRFNDPQGDRLGKLTGSFWTWQAGYFTLANAQGVVVAVLTVDQKAQAITLRSPSNRLHILGRFARLQQATQGSDSWILQLPPPVNDLLANASSQAIDPRVWPLVQAFFADAWKTLARDHTEG